MMDGSGQDNAGKARDTGLAESLQQAQEKLRADEALLRQFIEHVPAAVAMFDKEMHYIMASRRWMTDYHLGERNIIGLSHYEVFPEAPQRWREIHQRCLAGSMEHCEEDHLAPGCVFAGSKRTEVGPTSRTWAGRTLQVQGSSSGRRFFSLFRPVQQVRRLASGKIIRKLVERAVDGGH